MAINFNNRTEYKDDGCEEYGSCLNCPLVACKYDIPIGRQRRAIRVTRARQMLREGAKINEVAAKLDLSVRSIHRLLETSRTTS
tara:strand:+ start:685 stop:936 length:252 start_codon:yes stop_codon:yes gene_type:complete